ncbi:MAG: hypothetical protein GYA63_12035 [Armatimonadetes bacterium]|jgi:hypothetical protein|nr:hypothetical protein [Armatimonadota bacterium]HOC30621.1 dockerin type I repeat-containing protein [Armatimonadota bacterium]
MHLVDSTTARRRWVAKGAMLFLACSPALGRIVSGNVQGFWTSADNPIDVVSDIVVPSGRTLTVGNGVIIRVSRQTTITVSGRLVVYGKPSDPVHIDKIPESAPWKTILVTDSGQAELYSCVVRGGGAVAYNENSGMLRLSGGRLVLDGCLITDSLSSGVHVTGGSLYAYSSRFSNNGGSQPIDAAIHVVKGSVVLGSGARRNSITNGVFGIYNENLTPIDAAGTWWGDPTGPQHATNIGGSGVSVSDDVLFAGFADSAPRHVRGDVNGDGLLDYRDSEMAIAIAGGMAFAEGQALEAGDMNGDGFIDLLDVLSLNRAVIDASRHNAAPMRQVPGMALRSHR